MQADETIIPVYDTQGNVIDRKRRDQIDRQNDILKSAMVMVIDPEKNCYVVKPAQTAYPGLWLPSAATMVREREQPNEAIKRCLESELGLTEPATFLAERFAEMGHIKRFLCMYVLEAEYVPRHDPKDSLEVRWVHPHYIISAKEQFAPPVYHMIDVLKWRLNGCI